MYTFVRATIFAFFCFSIVYNDMFKNFSDFLKMPFESHTDWVEHKNFTGD